MEYDLAAITAILRKTPDTLHHLLSELPDDMHISNEGDQTWSPYDVIGHLIHGERTDWIPRAKIILSADDKQFEPFDRFAQERESAGKSMNQLLGEFSQWRTQNLAELEAMDLSDHHLNKTGIHPEFGEVTLRQLLATWAAHDMGHIYQISRVMAKQFLPHVGPWKKYIRALND